MVGLSNVYQVWFQELDLCVVLTISKKLRHNYVKVQNKFSKIYFYCVNQFSVDFFSISADSTLLILENLKIGFDSLVVLATS